jgi:hypothetical protein
VAELSVTDAADGAAIGGSAHSVRRVSAGSTRAARRAGTQQAMSAAAPSTIGTTIIISGSAQPTL